jgi:hypothetical protein
MNINEQETQNQKPHENRKCFTAWTYKWNVYSQKTVESKEKIDWGNEHVNAKCNKQMQPKSTWKRRE